MKKLILVIGLFIVSNSNAQNVVFDWAKQIGSNDGQKGNCSVVDNNGNVYTVGEFIGTVDFDPGAGTYFLTSYSTTFCAFVTKLDSFGNFIWAKQIGISTSPSTSTAGFIIIDKFGDLLISGDFLGTVDFDPGIGTYNLTSKGTRDYYVSKFSNSGSLIWVNQYGNVNSGFQQIKLASDLSGNILVTGALTGTIDFDPGVSVLNITSQGSYDVAVTKLNSNGAFQWARTIGNSGADYASTVTTDSAGNVYFCGSFTNTVDFDPGSGVANFTSSNSNSSDLFISKFNSAGIFQWAKQLAGSKPNSVYQMSIDKNGYIYIVGYFQGNVDFDPGLNVLNLTSIGLLDAFVCKLNNTGDLQWARQFGSANQDIASSICLDINGSVFVSGEFWGKTDFDPSSDSLFLTPQKRVDAFICKLTNSGYLQWVKQFGSSDAVSPTSVNLDKSKNIYLTGLFNKIADFNPGQGVYNLTSSISSDIFILRLKNCKPDYKIDTIVACGTFKWTDGKTYSSSNNTATLKLTNKNGCDSTVKLNLTLLFPNETLLPKICAVSIDSASNKNTVVWEKQGLNRATKYNVYRENTSSQFVKIGIVHRDSFSTFIDTGSYPLKQSYSYKVTLRDSCGQETLLDSSITHKTVHLTSNVGVGGEVNLIWNLYEGKSYTSHNIMRSANGGAFVKIAQVASNISAFSDLTPPSGSLVYKISLSSNVCRPSRSTNGLIQSNPVYIRPSAVNQIENLSFSIYPNPASSVIEIQSQISFSKVEILDIEGRLVKELLLDSNSYKVDVSGLCVGVYFVRVTYQGHGTVVQKILID